MANERKDILSRHLREVKAKRKSKSFNELAKRIRLEQELREILLSLKDEGILFREVLPSLISKQEFECTPDFLLWKHDMRVPTFLVGYEGSEHNISKNELFDYLDFLKRTDYDLIAVIWMSSPDFPSKFFKIVDIERMVDSEEETLAVSDVSPFKQSILKVFSEKAPVWPIPKHKEFPELGKPEILVETFESTFREVVQREAKRRRPRLPHRKEALQSISKEDFNWICSLLKDYFTGELNAKDLVRSLKKYVQHV